MRQGKVLRRMIMARSRKVGRFQTKRRALNLRGPAMDCVPFVPALNQA